MTRGDRGHIISAQNSDLPSVPLHDEDGRSSKRSKLLLQNFYNSMTYFSNTTLTKV